MRTYPDILAGMTFTLKQMKLPIKSAIKGLSSREQVKLDQILILESALNDPQVTKDYWKSLFDSQGADHARSLGIYSPQMVRLLTLQAILIPEMLPKLSILDV
ncbi:MAG: hypothetical protein RSE13_05790 [Planktothrix sp. GU0601_MAG3]|nr:MAG: hypothetical protein RSE13_05790 [Planktothrix sp. GU0601_MAG3]